MYQPLLKTFVCVADCGSFNKAADQLFISPPSVMKQVNNLEKHLDLTLLERTNQGIRLTASGQVIYHYAQQFLRNPSAPFRRHGRRRPSRTPPSPLAAPF